MDQLQREYMLGARRKAQPADYFDAEDSGDERRKAPPAAADDGDDEVDPLEAFMQGIDAQVKQQRKAPPKRVAEKPQVLKHEDDDADSYLEEYARTTKKPGLGLDAGKDDSDEEVYATAKQLDAADAPDEMAKKVMEVLAPIDHSSVHYEPFRKNFYTPHSETASLSSQEVAKLRLEMSVKVDGIDVPAPVRSFMHLGFDRKMLQTLMKLGLEAPTSIQAQAFPVALSGRDLIGIAKTGSGKTLAFTLPMVRHVMDQRELQRGEGPIAVVLAPTRELAHQTYVQAKKFLGVYGASCAAIYGGAGKWEQVQALKKGVEVVVATPGRLIEMIRKKAAPMNRVTLVVLDEADRMFEMGFEPQLRSVMGQIRPDCQTLMFSATFRRRIEALALDVLKNPIKLTIGQVGQANEDIRQIAVVLPGHGAKWPWLMARIRGLVDEGRLLIFAGSKAGCEELAKNLATAFPAAPALCLHGDKTQQERTEALAKFKHGECRVLVATDVAARGLDVKDVMNVVNFDVAKNIDTHVHRIGRTGRMGLEGFKPGTAYTLVTRNESQFAAQLVFNMDVSGQPVSAELLALAKRDPHFRRGGAAARGKTSTGNGTNGAAGWQSAPVSAAQQPNERENGALDAEDAVELDRWNDSRRKSKADQRKGFCARCLIVGYCFSLRFREVDINLRCSPAVSCSATENLHELRCPATDPGSDKYFEFRFPGTTSTTTSPTSSPNKPKCSDHLYSGSATTSTGSRGINI
ncbi:DEAD-box ATP-dependent RNA helicase 24 [Phytophthora fragariae]|uniref:RNA helicase n=1 Tax=Phytophthora fragariae TaxID=53985 RepID=A0A6A3JW76_9STRA|nr:DEAD-box ATP-dependent RNA helicase 24 [Phytophthora fragariae]KAE8997518.1 DEAD-box ATP-dependent RNA helicase 24 [Phytophthora fragariae]KAE9097108.1 DEAD-box ATP-dependent RNA helicase 24 [Phytophthora fragariae]KAE9131753.1 DEAD-box ATP-dependent RNA helicase 24 [Phytophthora fragariae]KAE9219618.1 DEAD-box ATP-dependent RNA helicase 24 [Phytophthora fragariae]